MATYDNLVHSEPGSDSEAGETKRLKHNRQMVLAALLVGVLALLGLMHVTARPSMATLRGVTVLQEEVPEEVVKQGVQTIEDNFNKNDTQAAALAYAPETLVTVNGGVDEGGLFTGTKPEEVAAFLDDLRNTMGGTNIKFKVTEVSGNTHKDTWTSDAGTGTSFATWAKDGDGSWKIVRDKITFQPKVTNGNSVWANGIKVTNGNIQVTNSNFVLANGNVEVTNDNVQAPTLAPMQAPTQAPTLAPAQARTQDYDGESMSMDPRQKSKVSGDFA